VKRSSGPVALGAVVLLAVLAAGATGCSGSQEAAPGTAATTAAAATTGPTASTGTAAGTGATATTTAEQARTVNTLTAEETGSATQNVPLDLTELASYFPNPENPLFWVTVRGGQAQRVEQQFLP